MKDHIPTALLEHYASGSSTLAILWRVERQDERVFGFTDHDREITFEGVVYEPSSAFDASAIASRSEAAVDNLEIAGILDSAGITETDIEAGRWDGAIVTVMRVNWADLSMGAEIIRSGTSGTVQRSGGRYVAEIRGLKQALQNEVGDVVTANCTADLGDTRCKVGLGSHTYAVSVLSSPSRAQLTFTGATVPAGTFTRGHVRFTSGANVGITREVKFHDAGDVVEFELPFPFDIEAGDLLDAVRGCDKTKATCKDVFDNVVNFRGFSFVPGTTDAMKLAGGG